MDTVVATTIATNRLGCRIVHTICPHRLLFQTTAFVPKLEHILRRLIFIDTRTERIVQDGMDKLMRGRTTFVIAHRLSTVRNSDCIMVLEQGRIIERGTHDELIEEKGRYYQLYTGNAISA